MEDEANGGEAADASNLGLLFRNAERLFGLKTLAEDA